MFSSFQISGSCNLKASPDHDGSTSVPVTGAALNFNKFPALGFSRQTYIYLLKQETDSDLPSKSVTGT